MNENSGFEVFKLYSALKLHFTSPSYDAIKYNFKTNVTQTSFLKNKAKYSYYKLSRKYSTDEIKNYLVSNFVYGKSTWIGELNSPEGEEIYTKWKKINQSLTYHFENDIDYLFDKYEPDEMLKVNAMWPKLLLETMEDNIKLETLVIMNNILNFFPMWAKKIDDDVIWPTTKLKCEKYTPFVYYDKEKFKTIIKGRLRNYE
jgi:hypothetical protein